MSASTKPIHINDFILAIKDLSDENLISIQSQLSNSMSKLKESNDLLLQEVSTTKEMIGQLKPEESHEELKNDLVLYTETIEENEEVINNQQERIVELNQELSKRGVNKTPATVPSTTKVITTDGHTLDSNNGLTESKDEKEVYL